jgi:hypothetical protein
MAHVELHHLIAGSRPFITSSDIVASQADLFGAIAGVVLEVSGRAVSNG